MSEPLRRQPATVLTSQAAQQSDAQEISWFDSPEGINAKAEFQQAIVLALEAAYEIGCLQAATEHRNSGRTPS